MKYFHYSNVAKHNCVHFTYPKFFKDEKNNDIYKLLDLEHIFLILFSVALASYETYKDAIRDQRAESINFILDLS
jgi:hypothetical protein